MEKIDYVHGKFVILSNDVNYDDFPYEEYVQECEEKGIPHGSSDSQEYADWVDGLVKSSWDDDLANIKYTKAYNVPVTITGELGLWDGKHEIKPVEMPSVYDAILKCIGRDADTVMVYFNDGHIDVEAYHHDGCNCFTIKAKKRLPYLYA